MRSPRKHENFPKGKRERAKKKSQKSNLSAKRLSGQVRIPGKVTTNLTWKNAYAKTSIPKTLKKVLCYKILNHHLKHQNPNIKVFVTTRRTNNLLVQKRKSKIRTISSVMAILIKVW